MYAIQARFGLGGPPWLDPLLAAGIFLFSILLALFFYKIVFRLLLRLAIMKTWDFDIRLVGALKIPVTLAIILVGTYLSLSLPLLGLSADFHNVVNTVTRVLIVVLGAYTAGSLVSCTVDWYMAREHHTISPQTAARLVPLFRRLAVLLVYGVGLILVLDQLNINISPLITGVGLGGLAVALAIQPTLANLFAGTYVMTEGVVSPGDYVELENGIAGYVVNVSWRSTRIRTWGNNLVIVPNSRFAETIITNYQEPTPAVNIYVTCGVSYESDLSVVERVSYEVMYHVLNNEPQAVTNYGCYFGYESFGDSNVNFWLFLQAKDRLGSFVVRSSLMQELHRRFMQEGIVINYPVRTLQFPREWAPRTLQDGADAVEGMEGVDGSVPLTPPTAANGSDRPVGLPPQRRRPPDDFRPPDDLTDEAPDMDFAGGPDGPS